jgi:hypothetical protein
VIFWISDFITEQFIAPKHRACDRLRVGIDQQIRRIEPMPIRGSVRSLDPIPVKLSRFDVRQKTMPDLVSLLPHAHTDAFALIIHSVEERQINSRGVLGK